MPSLIYWVFAILLALATASHYLHMLALIQQKDYVAKRLLASRPLLAVDDMPLEFLIILGLEIVPNLEDSKIMLQIAVVIFFILKEGFKIVRKNYRRPIFTKRMLLIISVLALFLLVLPIYTFFFTAGEIEIAAQVLASTTVVGMPIVLLVNQLVRIPVFRQHRKLMAEAKALLEKDKNIQIIGITGSYGKSSTKQFLSAILAGSNKKVLTTPGSINTDIGLAKEIITAYKKEASYDYGILEIDGYLKGTIARVVDYYPPAHTLLTPINEQHLETFGGKIENLLAGNYEIFSNLKDAKNSVHIFNNESDFTNQLKTKFETEFTNKVIYTYGSDDESDIYPSDIKFDYKPGHIISRFKLNLSNKLKKRLENKELVDAFEKVTFKLNILGDFNTVNFAGAVLMAILVNQEIDIEAIKQAGEKVELKSHTLDLSYDSKSGIEIIDDSFNANIAGVKGNAKILARINDEYKPAYKNIVFFSGLYETGKENAQHNLDAILEYAKIADVVVVTNPNLLGKLLNIKMPASVIILPTAEKQLNFIQSEIGKIAEKEQQNGRADSGYDYQQVLMRILLVNKQSAKLAKFLERYKN